MVAPERSAACNPDPLALLAADATSRRIWVEHLEPMTLAAGAALFREGDPADAMFLVASGELAVVLEVPGARRSEVRRLGPGQFLGEMALYRSEVRTATVEAVGAVSLWRLTAEALRRIEREHPELAIALHRRVATLLSERLRFSNVELKEPLARLAHALRGLADQDFAASAWDRPGVGAAAQRPDEVGAVAQAMSYLVVRLQTYIEELRAATAAREAIESELRIAGEIQRSLLPPDLRPSERQRVDFATFLRPAREAGGDLYDGFFLPDGRFLTLVGDVSGKGVPAAVFMALAATALRTLAPKAPEPGDLLAQVNRLLCERNATMQFVTACAVLLDPGSGDLAWANAGHPPPALLTPQGDLEWLDGPCAAPLGVFEETKFPTHRRVLRPGASLVVYSDGVSEAMDAQGRLLGGEGIAACLSGIQFRHSSELVERLVAAVEAHQSETPQADDITLVALRRPTG